MEAIEAIIKRRSIRKYKDKQVPFDLVATIFDAGRMAPSAGNLQNWKLIIVRDDAQRTKIAKSCLEQTWMAQAPVHIVIVSLPEKVKRFYGVRGERLYAIQNCAAVAENMLIAATGLELGSCWVSAFDEDMLRRTLGLPEEAIPQAVITLGYADEEPDMPMRDRSFSKFFFDRWGTRKNIGPSAYGWWSARTEKYLKDAHKGIKKLANKLSEKVKEKMAKTE